MTLDGRPWAVALLAVLIALSGCSALPGEGPIEATASPATVSESALEATGYSEVAVRSYAVNRTISIGNHSRQINVTNYVALYRTNYSGGQPAGFGVLSTPEIEILGQSVNPLGYLGKKALVRQLVSRVGRVKDLTRTGTTTVTMFGKRTEMTTFAGTATYGGRTVNVTAYFVRRKHGSDYVIAGGVHPAGLEAAASDIERLIRGIEHDASK